MCSFIVFLVINLALVSSRWSPNQAHDWYSTYSWSAGVNYIPAYADNQIQMWQELNLNQIDKQLTWAKQLGFSKLRVFLHIEPYIRNSTQFLKNIFEFLAVAKSRGHHVILVLFDDSWKSSWTFDRQPEPIPGLHNSQWIQCPGEIPIAQELLKNYVIDVIRTFKNSDTIVLWDLYNQVGNSEKFTASLPLCRKVFEWARQVNPSQPLTSGWWNDDKNYAEINKLILEQSDVITFHAYCDQECTQAIIDKLKQLDRPVICTEYMARPLDSLFSTHLPMFKQENVWALSWGFVFGRTQTYFPWWSKEGDLVPDQWFCDVVNEDGSPFSKAQAELIKQITQHQQDNLKSQIK